MTINVFKQASAIGMRRAIVLAPILWLAGCAGPRSPGTGSRAGGAGLRKIVVSPQQRGEVVLTAMGLLESQYNYGGSHPVTGFDCSGLVAYVFQNAVQESLPHNTAEIARLSTPISRKHLKAGDFVFFNTLGRPFSHMGIYIGDNQFVNAPSSGGRVRVDSLLNPYFAKRFESARTLFAS